MGTQMLEAKQHDKISHNTDSKYQNKLKNWQIRLQEIKKYLKLPHSKGNFQQSRNTTYPMGKNTFPII